jgi:leucyl-tRNA---protein transferase
VKRTGGAYHGRMSASRRDPDEPAAADDPLLAWVDRDGLPRTPTYPCPYVPGRTARQRGFLAESLDAERYHELMDRGFRRSGQLFYAMDCEQCRACVPIRVPVAQFTPTRSQRRAWKKNLDVAVAVRQPECNAATHALYRRYLAHQHPGHVGDESEASLRESLYAAVVDTVEMTYSLGDRLVAVSLLDVCSRSVSAVYHFYDPEFAARSLGVFSALAEIEWCKQLGVPHYYLGYWIEGAETMHYKANYGPHELLLGGRWQPAPSSPPRQPHG